MEGTFDRTRLLLGNEAMDRLASARVAVFGVGGVGGYVVEALARSGIGSLDLIDNDTVAPSNLNRQIIATRSAIGRFKTEVMRDRIADINPEATVQVYNCFVLPDNIDTFPFDEYDYVVDAVDTVTAKLCIIEKATSCGVPVISSMGAGNKLDGSRFRIVDLFDTTMDPLAKVMRRELRKRGIDSLKVVWSDEPPLKPRLEEAAAEAPAPGRRATPGSVAFVPSVAGLLLAGAVVQDLIGI